MKEYIATLGAEFERNSNASIALEQKAYLRNQFEFYGIKTTERRELLKPFLSKDHLPLKSQLLDIIKKLWGKPQRDYQYFGQELAYKYIKQLEIDDLAMFEYMVTNKSWWDTVDFIANKLMGEYFKKFPDEKVHYVNKWLHSGNIWLQRSALLFQLKYKENIDLTLLSSTIERLVESKEFFINKAIGWVLREYSRTNPEWVRVFADQTELSPLSRKEALRLIS
ncbi:MAG TPA: DNA alkylation repair protein [Cytophagaceae bacterium]|jgi:3-methyladenine DNA glycosylase AlkD